MQEQVSVEVGVPAFDFGEIWEGWQSHQQMVHPLLVSFAIAMRTKRGEGMCTVWPKVTVKLTYSSFFFFFCAHSTPEDQFTLKR